MAKAKERKFSLRDMFKMSQGHGYFTKLSARHGPTNRPHTPGSGPLEGIKRIMRS